MATLRSVLKAVKEKHFKIAESSGSLGIIGIIVLVVAFIILWKQWLGKFTLPVAFIMCLLVPLLNL